MATSLDLSRTYTSYSGVDIRVVINGKPAGSMQALSYAIQREKAPIYVMGSVDPISYSRGKRGIAGTMISLMMDRHFLHSDSFANEKYLGDKDEMFASIIPDGSLDNAQGGDGQVSLTYNDSPTPGAQGTSPVSQGQAQRPTYDVASLSSNYQVSPVYYVDQILPFDIAIVAANEYGQSAQMRLYGCEILNEGSGFSIDDIVIENQMTYVCRTILPWRSFKIEGSDAMYQGNRAARNYAGGQTAQN
jgi:hypothetical protein